MSKLRQPQEKNMAESINPSRVSVDKRFPQKDLIDKIVQHKKDYEKNYGTPGWTRRNFNKCPWGIAYHVSIGKTKDPYPALSIYLIALLLNWKELIDQMARALRNHKIDKSDLETISIEWYSHLNEIVNNINDADSRLVAESLEEALIDEDVEKHDELNPKLFENGVLKEEVREKIEEIVTEFVNYLAEDEIKIAIDDVILIGSNVSYNYTKDSDLDIHIIVNLEDTQCPDELYPKLYSAYRSLFNKKFNIDFYGIPVEIYVETPDTDRVSNGEYSVRNNKWNKEPVKEDIPDIDMEAFEAALQPWLDKYQEVIENAKYDEINDYITDVYALRKAAIANEGEYSQGNLIFKEIRNRGYLDNLKDLLDEVKSKELSLESLSEGATCVNCFGLDTKYPEVNFIAVEGTTNPAYAKFIYKNKKYIYTRDLLFVVANFDREPTRVTSLDYYTYEDLGNIKPSLENYIRFIRTLAESINNSLTEDIDPAAKKVISDLIKDEWEATSGYNDAICKLQNNNHYNKKVVDTFAEIAAEEEAHVGELQACLQELGDAELKINLENGTKEFAETETMDSKAEKDSIDDSQITAPIKPLSNSKPSIESVLDTIEPSNFGDVYTILYSLYPEE